MKAVQTRENVRKLKLNPHQSKEVQSQSPPHKKLLKKIEMIHKEPTHKYDLSLKENLLAKEPEEEVAVDFRVEIERRFNKALPNQIFKFPRRPSAGASDGDDSSSSTDSSFESLKHVTIYDLSSQNNKRKHNTVKQALRGAVTDEKRMPKSVTHRTQTGIDADMSDDSILFEEEERSGVPIEIRMRDKTTATYRKLLSLIDQQLNPAPEVQPPSDVLRAQLAKKQQNNQEQHSAKVVPAQEKVVRDNTQSEYNKSNTKTTEEQHHDVEIHKLEPFKTKKERNVRSQGRNDRPSHHYSESQRASKAVSNSGLQIMKKNLSQEKMGKIETVPSLGFSGIEKTLSRLNISTAKGESKTTVDLSKLTQESFKKLYNNSLLKSVTPQYVKSSKIQNLKENVFKAYAQENPSSNVKTTMDNLYQKAKNEVLNHKLKVSGVNLTRSHTKIGNNSMSATKRDETPKDAARKINFNNFYGNTDIVIDKSASKGTGSQSMSKKESMKAFQVASPYKKQPADSPVYANYEFTQPKVAKKPSFKLDLNKRGQAYRDALSSARNRKKRTPDKFSDVLTTESAIRNSYDMQQFSYILNSSSQKNTGKKPIGFTPSSVAKNMSFTKAFFSFK